MVFDQTLFNRELARRKIYIEEYMTRFISPDVLPLSIHQAMQYAVFNGGKRLRPILVLEGAALAGGSWDLAAPTACAMEFIHCHSLVHDDLPAMDDDDFRRGKPTCHKVFGEALAILTGDALLDAAFAIMAGQDGLEIPAERILKVIAEVASAIGSEGMTGGQVLDLEAEKKSVSYEELQLIHNMKTGLLFTVSLRAGAILSGMNERLLQRLTDYARHFGLAFQIIDDILDVCGDQDLLGKPVGSDEKRAKSTYVSLLGMDKAWELAEKSVARCWKSLDEFGPEAGFLRDLAEYVLLRQN